MGKKVGRPSKFRPEFVEQVYKLCLLGATDEQLADFFDVSVQTIHNWVEASPEFLEARKKGKVRADVQVAHALYQKALGAEWVEEQAIKVKRVEYENGKRKLEEERVEVVEVIKRAPPDTTAQIFWLKNRDPQHWRDKQEHEHTHKFLVVSDVDELDAA